MGFYREATPRPRIRGEPGVVGDGDGADDGQSEAVVVVDAGAVESLAGVEKSVDLLRRDHRAGVRDGDDSLVALDPGGDLHPAAGHVVAHGVVQQVGDESFDQCRVARRWGVRDRSAIGGAGNRPRRFSREPRDRLPHRPWGCPHQPWGRSPPPF